MYAGVTQAGDVVLNAPAADINLDKITVKSSGNSHFTANFTANAGNNFNASGLIDVEAVANGVGAQTADAEIHITAGNAIVLHGLKDIASAFEAGGAQNAIADAGVVLNGNDVVDVGVLSVVARVGGHTGASSFPANFVADAHLDIANAAVVTLDSGLTIQAFANASHVGSAVAKASANFANDGIVTVTGSVEVGASVLGNNVGNDIASAFATIHSANAVTIEGNAIVEANAAATSALGASFARANAHLDIVGSQVNVTRTANVHATANNFRHGSGASATANLFVVATNGVASFHDNIEVQALAFNGGGAKDADAFAHLAVNAADIEISNDVIVTANGQTAHLASHDSSVPNATADAVLLARSGRVFIGGNL